MARRAVPDIAIDFIRKHEACVLRVYDDWHPTKVLQVGDHVEGTLTAGWGHTGPDLYIGMIVTLDMAVVWLKEDLNTAAFRLSQVVTDAIIHDMTDHQYGAMVSFVFNLGNGIPRGKTKSPWTIWKVLNARDYDQMPQQIMRFVNQTITEVKVVDGKEIEVERKVKVDGLVKRRAAEVIFWSTEEPGSVPVTVPSSVTRRESTPPTPADPVPITKSKAFYAGVTAAVAGGPNAVDNIIKKIGPYAQSSDYVQQAVGILGAIGALLVGLTFVLMWLQKRKAQN